MNKHLKKAVINTVFLVALVSCIDIFIREGRKTPEMVNYGWIAIATIGMGGALTQLIERNKS